MLELALPQPQLQTLFYQMIQTAELNELLY